MKNTKTETKKSFWGWLHQNRLKVVTLTFIIVTPITLLLVAYLGSYTVNKVTYYEQTETVDTVYVDTYKGLDDIAGFELFIEWEELKYPVEVEGSDALVGGYYRFSIYYEANPNYTINSIYVTPLLQTDWTDMRSLGTTFTARTDSRLFLVEFNYHLPVRPLWFVKVSEPNLYLKVEYSVGYGGTQVTKTEYIKYSMKGLNPNLVIND
jgi:hypothetical protein